jgi:ABC-2 type transport system permease protein
MSRRRGAMLVAGREVRERVRTRTFRVTTVLLVAAALAAVAIPALVGDDGPSRSTEAAAAAASGEVDAAVISGATGPVRVVVEDEISDDLRGLIAQAVAGARVSDALARSGLPPAEVAEVVAPPDLEVQARGERAVVEGGDLAVGFVVALVLYLALLFSGILVATGVAEEKSTRVSEVLLASARRSSCSGRSRGSGWSRSGSSRPSPLRP